MSNAPPFQPSPFQRFLEGADQGARLLGNLLGNLDRFVDDIKRDSAQVAQESQALLRAVQSQYRQLVDGAAASPKAMRIARSLLLLAARYRIEEGRRAAQPAAGDERLRELHRWGAAQVLALCLRERGAVLKLGQILSMRPDLLPPAYIEALSTLREGVPPLPFDELRPTIEAELGVSMDDCFEWIDEEAVAAASLAQVHKARLHGGELVALKVLVPDAVESIRSDLALLRAVAAVIGDVELPFDARAILDELARSLGHEVNYESEAHWCESMGEQLASHPELRAPRLIREHCRPGLLCMEWVEARSVDRALESMELELRRRTLDTLCSSFIRQILREGRFHGDPHAGNILCTDEGKLVLIDFGCVYELSEDERRAYRQLMQALVMSNATLLEQCLVTLGFATDDKSAGELRGTVELMLDAMKDADGLKRWAADPSAATQELLAAMQEAQGLRTPEHFVLVGRVLANLAGLLIAHADTGVNLPALLFKELASSPH